MIGKIPSSEEQNFFIIDKSNYLERIKDIIDVSDKEVTISKNSFGIFKEEFRADLFEISESYEKTADFTKYKTELDFENLYPDQKSALSEMENFIKSEEERFFVLQGTSLSGKTHLVPFIKDIAFNNQRSEVKLFASSGRVANNLLKNSNLEFESIYSYIYGGNTTNKKIEDSKQDEETIEDELDLEVVPLKKSDNPEEAIFIVDESHLISNNYHQSIDLRFGSGKLLKDFIEFTDLKNSKRKIIFIGDSFQLSIGKKEETALNPEYLTEEFGFKTKAFQLIDKENKSLIVSEALKSVNSIRQQTFNNLAFDFSDTINQTSKEKLKDEIDNSLKTSANSHILCYTNSDAQKVNNWIKKSIIKNGNELTKGDLVIFENNIRVENENDPFAEPKKVFNGQFGTIVEVSEPITKTEKLITPLSFRKVTVELQETKHILNFLSFENYRLSDKGEVSKEEIISFKILLNQLAEKEIENFKNGKYFADEELKKLLTNYDSKTRKGVTKIRQSIQKHLRNTPSSDYYKYKNVAQLRYGWALTVHKAMSYKWNEIFFNVERGTGKTNEDYFKWIYTGIIRATQKVNFINYEPITPFSKISINPAIPKVDKGKDFFYLADTTTDISHTYKETVEKFKFPESENQSALLQLFQFIESKLSARLLTVNLINHSNYQELYEIKGGNGEVATISIYYNKKGQFKLPSLMKATPKEFGDELLDLLNSENQISNFEFIKNSWRKTAYEQLNDKLQSKDMFFGYIIQAPFKDTIQINQDNNTLILDMYYDGDGFFSSVIASSCTETELWADFQNVINEIKQNR